MECVACPHIPHMSLILIFSLLFISSCASTQRTMIWEPAVTALSSTTNASLRGLSVVNSNVAWASGTRGTVLLTTNSGATWQQRNVPNADSLDFRDIEAFDSLTAYVLSAGEDGRIYRTDDGGRTWHLRFRNEVKGAFFDCFDFFDRDHGLAMSDPVNGRYLVIETDDGNNWRAIDGPQATEGEAAFAANGSCLTIAGSRALIASGGGATARVFASDDRGRSWRAIPTPVPAGAPAAGIFALAFRDANNGIATGGNYQKPNEEAIVAVTRDGGKSWQPAGQTSYTSGAAISPHGKTLIAVGTPGTRVSNDQGMTWKTIDAVEYNAVQFANDRLAFAVGPQGRVARIAN